MTTVNAVKDVSGIKTDHAAIAENVNSNFTDIGPRLAEQIPVSEVDAMSFLTQTRQNFNFKFIIVKCVADTIRKIPSSKAAGIDKIPCKIFKSVVNIIDEPLSEIFNKSFSSGIFPDDLKTANGSARVSENKGLFLNNAVSSLNTLLVEQKRCVQL